MSNFYNNTPEEVQKVWVIQMMGSRIGGDLYKEVQDIISRNPKYFPYETAYNKIPKEVHEAYFDEEYQSTIDTFESFFGDEEKIKGQFSDGLLSSLRQTSKPTEVKSLKEILEDLIAQDAKNKKIREDKTKRKKEIWDKHYKKYGLEYKD